MLLWFVSQIIMKSQYFTTYEQISYL